MYKNLLIICKGGVVMLVFRSSGRVLGESPFGVPRGLVRSIVFQGSGRVLGEGPFGVPGEVRLYQIVRSIG